MNAVSLRRGFFTKGCLSPKVVFHWRLSSTKGCLPPKVIFHQKSSSTKGHLPSKVVFHWRSYSTKGRLPTKVFFHQRLILHLWVVSIPNLSLIPCLEVALNCFGQNIFLNETHKATCWCCSAKIEQSRTLLYDIARQHLMTLMNFWQNSIPFFKLHIYVRQAILEEDLKVRLNPLLSHTPRYIPLSSICCSQMAFMWWKRVFCLFVI